MLVLSLAAALPVGARAAPVPVPVLGRAVVPNAYEPALPCTLWLDAPGDRLTGRGLHMFAEPAARPLENGTFDYLPFGPDDFRFDQVNVFWHAQRFLERLERLGLDLEEHPIYVRVQTGAGSFTHFIEPVSTIGTGLNGLDQGAKDADIIVHEITHAVFNPRMPLGTYPLDKGESIPVLEGLADYFAAAVNGGTRIGEFARPPSGYHDLASDPAVFHYSRWDALPADPYSRGKVLNGALLEIRSAIGETADELVLGALDHAPLRCFTCIADGVRWADVERYDGAHLGTIDAAFARRGIGSGPPAGVRIDAPAWGWNDTDVTARVRHSCGAGPFEFTWQVRNAAGAVQVLPSTADTAVFRATGPVTLEATMRDRHGESYPVAPVSVASYDPSDPALHVDGVRLQGPVQTDAGLRARFTCTLVGGAGVPPATVRWSAQNAVIQAGPPNAMSVEVIPWTNPLRLRVTYQDASGQVAEDSVTVTVVQPLASGSLTGPTVLQEGQAGVFRVRPQGGTPPYRYAWLQQSSSGSVTLPDTSDVTSLPASGDFTMRVTVTDTRNVVSGAALAVRVVLPLRAGAIEGPATVTAGQPAVFRMSVLGGVAPYQYRWIQQTPYATYVLSPASQVATLPTDADFLLGVTVTDATATSVTASRMVHTTPAFRIGLIEGPPSVVAGQTAVFRVSAQGGTPPFRYLWYQQDANTTFDLGESSEATSRPAERDYTLTAVVVDALNERRATSRAVKVSPAPPESRTFRVMGNVLRRGAHLALQLPTPDVPGELEILDTAGRLRASGRIPAGSGATLSVPLPGYLDSGVYFVRLRRSDRDWTARIVLIAK